MTANWPVYVLFAGALGATAGLATFVAGLVRSPSRLTVPGLALALVSAAAGIAAFSSSYWQKPECYLPNGELDESREECRFATSVEDLRDGS